MARTAAVGEARDRQDWWRFDNVSSRLWPRRSCRLPNQRLPFGNQPRPFPARYGRFELPADAMRQGGSLPTATRFGIAPPRHRARPPLQTRLGPGGMVPPSHQALAGWMRGSFPVTLTSIRPPPWFSRLAIAWKAGSPSAPTSIGRRHQPGRPAHCQTVGWGWSARVPAMAASYESTAAGCCPTQSFAIKSRLQFPLFSPFRIFEI